MPLVPSSLSGCTKNKRRPTPLGWRKKGIPPASLPEMFQPSGVLDVLVSKGANTIEGKIGVLFLRPVMSVRNGACVRNGAFVLRETWPSSLAPIALASRSWSPHLADLLVRSQREDLLVQIAKHTAPHGLKGSTGANVIVFCICWLHFIAQQSCNVLHIIMCIYIYIGHIYIYI